MVAAEKAGRQAGSKACKLITNLSGRLGLGRILRRCPGENLLCRSAFRDSVPFGWSVPEPRGKVERATGYALHDKIHHYHSLMASDSNRLFIRKIVPLENDAGPVPFHLQGTPRALSYANFEYRWEGKGTLATADGLDLSRQVEIERTLRKAASAIAPLLHRRQEEKEEEEDSRELLIQQNIERERERESDGGGGCGSVLPRFAAAEGES